jgi:hypothetical protein
MGPVVPHRVSSRLIVGLNGGRAGKTRVKDERVKSIFGTKGIDLLQRCLRIEWLHRSCGIFPRQQYDGRTASKETKQTRQVPLRCRWCRQQHQQGHHSSGLCPFTPRLRRNGLPRERALRISTIYGFDVSTERSSRIMPLRPPASSSPTASGQGCGCRPNPTPKANSGPQKVRPGSRLAAHGPLSLNGFAQHLKCGVTILRRTEYSGASELHRAVAHAVYGPVAELERARGGDVCH